MTNMNMLTRDSLPENKGSALQGCPINVKEFNSVNPVRLFAGDNHSFILAKNKVEFIYNEKRESMLDTSMVSNNLNTTVNKTEMTVTPRDLQTRISNVINPENLKNVDVESLVNMNIDFAEIKIENKIAEGGYGVVYKAR